MNEFIKATLARYPGVELTSDKEAAAECIASIQSRKGACPCNASMHCPCPSVAAVHQGKVQECRCGLFVRKGEA